MGTHLFTVVVSYRGKKPSWWGDPNGSVMVQSDYVLHKGKTRPMAVRWTMPIDYDPITKKGHSEYDAEAKVYRSSYAIDIPEAQDASPSTYAGELKMIYRGYVPGQDKGVKFTVPVPRIPKGKKTGSG
jgi:hypothetical protein